MKQCTKCQIIKPKKEFYRANTRGDGLQPWCKGCHRAWAKSPAGKESNRKKTKKYRETDYGRKINIEATKRFHKTPKGRKLQRKYRRKYRQRFRARVAVGEAVRQKKMSPANTLICISCGNNADHYHHHKGYAEELKLDVIPLCRPCHQVIHVPHSQQ